MDNHAANQSEWGAAIIALVLLGVALGVEQALPVSDVLRTQIGILTVLLTFGFWHLLDGLIQPGKN